MSNEHVPRSRELFSQNYTSKFRVDQASWLFCVSADGPPLFIDNELAGILDHCRDFRTLDEHAERLATIQRRTKTPGEVTAVKAKLLQLAELGLLVSDTEILAACEGAEPSRSQITSLGVLTHNRPDSLLRCLRSYLENCRTYGRRNDFVVVDDSETASTRAANKQIACLLKREYAAEIFYAGLEEKTRFAETLISEGSFEPELVRFALLESYGQRFSCGKNRNALFLHNAGELFFSTDDDAVCALATPPSVFENFYERAPSHLSTPVEFWFFGSRDEAVSQANFVEKDLLAAHEQLLGKSLSECLLEFKDVRLVSLDRPVSHHLGSVKSGQGRVLATVTGMLGDSGVRLPPAYQALRRSSRIRLIESEESYRSGCVSREMLRIASRYAVSGGSWFVSTAVGLDNRLLLPPFSPAFRGVDGVFEETIRRCYEHGYFGDVPLAVLHAPAEPRSYDRQVVLQLASTITMSSLLSLLIFSKHFWPNTGEPEKRMRDVGRHLLELGSMPLRTFEQFVRHRVLQQRTYVIADLERHLAEYESAPAYWANDLKTYIAAMRKSLTDPAIVVPGDLLAENDLDTARALSRRFVGKFGQLLYEWPDMVSAAKSLRDKGTRLASPV